jgi:hypothetical protein
MYMSQFYIRKYKIKNIFESILSLQNRIIIYFFLLFISKSQTILERILGFNIIFFTSKHDNFIDN